MRTRCFLLMLFVGINCLGTAMASYTLTDIKNMTNGKGVFSVTIKNKGNHRITSSISVRLISPPDERYCYGFAQEASIEKGLSAVVYLPKPLVGNFPDYIGDGPKLSEKCKVMVAFGDGDIFIPSDESKFIYTQAKYVPNTKFIETPNITIEVGGSRQPQSESDEDDDPFSGLDLPPSRFMSVEKK